MSRYTGPRNKIAKRYNVNLWGRFKDPLVSTKKGQGKAPFRRPKRRTIYALRLEEKQKLRYYYGVIRESQFRSYFLKAKKTKGNTGISFLRLLESRLDVLIYRMNLVSTIFGARQLVAHGHIKVNGKKVDIPSYIVSPDEVISITEKTSKIPMIADYAEYPERLVPEYVTFDRTKLEGKMIRLPERDEIVYPFVLEEQLIIEYYSR